MEARTLSRLGNLGELVVEQFIPRDPADPDTLGSMMPLKADDLRCRGRSRLLSTIYVVEDDLGLKSPSRCHILGSS